MQQVLTIGQVCWGMTYTVLTREKSFSFQRADL